MSRRKQPIVDVEGLEHEDKKELNESELTAVTQLPNLLSIVNESKPTQNFAKFAMQVVSVQRLSSNSEEEDPFLEKYTNIPKTETSFKEDVLSERSSKTTSKSSDQSRKKTRSSFLHLDPLSNWYLFWLFVVSLGVAYNYWTIILRLAFVEGQGKHCQILVILDYVIDSLFLLDIWVQSRTGYMENGELVIKVKKTRRHYMRTLGFLSDCLAVLPTDLLYFAYGINPVFRLGRLLKFHRFLSFYERVEVNTNHHNLFNLTMLIHHVFLIIHWVACVYFLISKNVGYGSDAWVYPALRGEWAQITRQYVYCFYLSSVTMTIVGNLPTPKTPETLLFVIVMYLAGVLVFAMIVGSACEMITSMTIKRTEFHRKINEIKVYMQAHSVPDHLQKRVFKWFDYLWMEKIDLHDEDTFELLPEKCKADILLHVNLDTLKKVEIFEECEPSFLRELVLRLRPTQCCPGDYVCDQGEVGNEMYIVSKGQLEVEVDEQVVATLTPGNHFGEISILDIDGVGNRRTASIRSVGFSQLFKLAKNDLQQALQDYPDARREMEKKAAEILKKDHERKRSTSPEEEIEAKKSCPPDWLAADSVTLQDQIRKVEMQLKEKKLRSIKEKIKKQQAERNKQLIRSFAKRNFLSQNAQEFLQHFVAVNQINEFPILKEKSSNTL